MHSGFCHLLDCSMMFLRINTCPIGHLPSRNTCTACSHVNFGSMPSLIHSITSLPRTLFGTESKEIMFPRIVACSQISLLLHLNNHSLPIICPLHILAYWYMLKQYTVYPNRSFAAVGHMTDNFYTFCYCTAI